MKNHLHLHDSVIPVLDLTLEERIQWIKRPRWIGYPRAKEILNKLDDLVRHPKQLRMPNMLLIGGTNNGKTSIVRAFAQRYPTDPNLYGEKIICDVLYVQAPPGPSETGIYSQILGALFEKIPTASVEARRNKTIEVLRGIGLKVLIIDELHNVLAGSTIKQQHFFNVIKFLGNELQISIVGCGTSDLLRAVSIDPQIQNRFPPELITKWTMGTEFRQLLKSFEMTLPLKNASFLHEKILASKILAMCEGSIGELSQLLNQSVEFALRNGLEEITSDVLNASKYISPSDRTSKASRV